MPKVMIINGPNLNLLGTRETDIYGARTLDDIMREAQDLADGLGLSVEARQSNHEGDLVDWIQEARTDCAAIVINAGAYTHTSIAILDALKAFEGQVVEVHMSNIHARESFRHHSWISARADGLIAGLGPEGYFAALRFIAASQDT